MKWFRTSRLNNKGSEESWLRVENENSEQFPISVDFGKRTDLLKLKKNVVAKIEENFEFYFQSRSTFFSNDSNLEKVLACPACGSAAEASDRELRILEAEYYNCRNCTHKYLRKIPTLAAIEEFYRRNTQYAQTYTDRGAAEFRLNSVDMALAEYMINKYSATYESTPGRILDIGAGGGHFVEACQRKGMTAAGFEFSDSSVQFANDVWNIQLDQRDYTKAYRDFENFDVVTFWGLLEHVPNPLDFVRAAAYSTQGSAHPMIICRVPKWDSVSTAVQSVCRESIVRHLDPLGHIMIYTESSLCELFRRAGFKPVSIWYYGMDSYEFLMQVGHASGSYSHLATTSDIQQEVQQQLDNNYLSDLMVMAFIPNK